MASAIAAVAILLVAADLSGAFPGVPGAARIRAIALQPLSWAAEANGYSLRQVSVTGLRFTSDKQVFDALALPSARTLLVFDSNAARARIEALPWIESARISRIFPDGLDVRVVERKPAAVLRAGASNVVVDASGRQLASIAPGAMPGLPRIASEDAEAAAMLLAGLSRHPPLLTRLRSADRHAGRWTLHIRDGASLRLPTHGAQEALARGAALLSAGLAERGVIDLQLSSRKAPERIEPNDHRTKAADVTLSAGRS